MKRQIQWIFGVIAAVACLLAAGCSVERIERPGRDGDPLPSWHESGSREAIIDFVEAVVDESGPDFVSPTERIAVFDNDGTLWSEQPAYFQLEFVLDRIRELAPGHPEWKDEQPFKAALDGDMETLAESGEHGLLKLVMATHAGVTTGEFEKMVKDWIVSERHSRFERTYSELIFQTLLEVLDYLRANDFKVYIVL